MHIDLGSVKSSDTKHYDIEVAFIVNCPYPRGNTRSGRGNKTRKSYRKSQKG